MSEETKKGFAPGVYAAGVVDKADLKKNDTEEEPQEEIKKPSKASVLGVFGLIFAIIGIISSAYGYAVIFIDIKIAIAFFAPTAVAIILGIIAFPVKAKTGRLSVLAVIGLIIGLITAVGLGVLVFVLKMNTDSLYGASDLMNMIRYMVNR